MRWTAIPLMGISVMATRGLTLGPLVVAAGTALTLVLFFATARQNVDEMRILSLIHI